MLALTGPYRALVGTIDLQVEFDLKIKGEGAVDKDFSKGLLVLNAFRNKPGIPYTFSLKSYLSSVDMVCVCLFLKPWKLLLESTF